MDHALAFRPPQFSEDLAWLPGWAQHQVEQFDKEPLGSPKIASEDFNRGEDQILLSREEGGQNNYYLFLSGEDNSPSSFASSCRNVLHFHLHLSSDGCSQRILSEPDTSQTVYETDKDLLMQEIETSIALKDNRCEMSFNHGDLKMQKVETSVALKENRRKMSSNSGDLNILPQSSNPEPCPLYPSNSKDDGEKLGVRHLKDAEINEAVELSIAASEALVIHEIVKSKPDVEALVTTDALEFSLRVKQARLEWLEDAIDSSTKETDDNDSLSDLDDFAMMDAFEDVGLICSTSDQNANASTIFHVKETPASGNHCGRAGNSECIELWAQQVNFDGISTQKQFGDIPKSDATPRKDLPLESLNSDKHEKVFGVCVFGSNTTNIVRETDSSTPKNQSAIVGLAAVHLTLSQSETEENVANCDSSLNNACELRKIQKDRMIYPVPERFRSRWLGGWTAEKDVEASAQLTENNAKNILKAFTCETSFLSESADIAPDENSFVQIRETDLDGGSQSSVAIVLDNASKEILLSQDVVRSSNISLVDPLCSVVPCSISSEDTNSAEAQNQNNKETDFKGDVRTRVEPEMGNSGNISSLNVRSPCGNGQVMSIVDEGSEGLVRRQLTSLRTYSTFFPDSVATSDMGSLHYNGSFQPQFSWGHLALDQNMRCIGASDKGCSKQTPLFSFLCKSFAGTGNEEFCGTMVNGNSIEKLKKKNTTDHETTRDVDDSPVHSPKGRVQPLLLNRRVRHCLRASKPSAPDFYGEEHAKQALGVEDQNRIQPSKTERPQNIQSDYNNSLTGHFPARKRVRFSEADVRINSDNNARELHFSKRNCSTTTTNKKLKDIYTLSDQRSCEEIFLNRCSKVSKGLIFQGIRFLLTGLSRQKGKDVKGRIQKHGGIILSDIPFPPNLRRKKFSRSSWHQLPIILSLGKQRTSKFLYGCAVKAFILHVDWLTDSIGVGSVLPPEKYLILRWQDSQSNSIWTHVPDIQNNGIFEKVGIMLHGKHSFCIKFAKIVKHGDGKVFKALQWLVHNLDKENISVGVIVTEDENVASRHLKQCACERKIPMMPSSWIIKSLHSGKLLPFTE